MLPDHHVKFQNFSPICTNFSISKRTVLGCFGSKIGSSMEISSMLILSAYANTTSHIKKTQSICPYFFFWKIIGPYPTFRYLIGLLIA